LDTAAHVANEESAKTTKLCDRTPEAIGLGETDEITKCRAIFIDDVPRRSLEFWRCSRVLPSSSEVSMLRISMNNSRSEHDLFIRLFLTSGGGW
jgi:hypothetical protein